MRDPEALAFDVYGTLVDPIGIDVHLQRYLPEKARSVAEVWRQKQLEYTFRLTAMERYEDFERVTRMALDYALAAAGQALEPDQKDALMARYDSLEPFSDVEAGLERLKDAGHTMVVFSNGTARMLESLLQTTGLRRHFGGFVSVDEIKTYKPSPRAYRHAARRLGRPIAEVRLVSSNPFDNIGAEAAGMRAAWIDRSGGLFDTLASPPEIIAGTLTELADALEALRP